MLPTIEEAQKLLEEHVKDDYQKLHSKMVAEAMKSWAHKIRLSDHPGITQGDDTIDENLWYLTGLLHDLDYFEFPEEHPKKSMEWFKEWGYPESLITAVAEHAFMRTNIEVKTFLGSALIACDELSGFIYAYKLMRPDGLNGMDPKGVKKRLKDKHFAAKIDREDINFGVQKFAEHLGKNPEELLNEHIETLIGTFQKMPEFN